MILLIVIVVIAVLVGGVAFFGAPYVPSHVREVRGAFRELRPLTSQDVVADLGSGDGRVLKLALQCGAGRVVGYELHPLLVMISRLLLRGQPATVHMGNMWHAALPGDVTVLYAFTVGRDTKRLAELVQRWANEQQRSLELIVYGHTLPGGKVVKTLRAHTLYRFEPTGR